MKQKINFILSAIVLFFFGTAHADIIQYGKMREALALGKTEARVDLTDLTKKPHLYAVGAIE